MPKKTPTYETAIAELEAIINQMETGTLPLEQSIDVYKRGAELLKICQKSLKDAEQQVSILSEENKLEKYTVNTKQSEV